MQKAEQDILMCIAEQNRRGNDCLLTSGILRKSDAEKLVNSGHVNAMSCVKVDDDGRHLEPERWTTGYELTELGRQWLDSMVTGPNGYADPDIGGNGD